MPPHKAASPASGGGASKEEIRAINAELLDVVVAKFSAETGLLGKEVQTIGGQVEDLRGQLIEQGAISSNGLTRTQSIIVSNVYEKVTAADLAIFIAKYFSNEHVGFNCTGYATIPRTTTEKAKNIKRVQLMLPCIEARDRILRNSWRLARDEQLFVQEDCTAAGRIVQLENRGVSDRLRKEKRGGVFRGGELYTKDEAGLLVPYQGADLFRLGMERKANSSVGFKEAQGAAGSSAGPSAAQGGAGSSKGAGAGGSPQADTDAMDQSPVRGLLVPPAPTSPGSIFLALQQRKAWEAARDLRDPRKQLDFAAAGRGGSQR
jgi:hypothetical protein